MNINKVFLYGNLTRDPELRQTQTGLAVVNVAIATNRIYTNKDGEKTSDVEYHNVVLFGRLGEISQQYLKKGSGVFIEGRLRTSSWEADGVKKYRTEVIAEQMQFGPRRVGDSNGGDDYKPADTGKKEDEYPEATISPDDIPF